MGQLENQRTATVGLLPSLSRGWGILPQLGGWKPPPRVDFQLPIA